MPLLKVTSSMTMVIQCEYLSDLIWIRGSSITNRLGIIGVFIEQGNYVVFHKEIEMRHGKKHV
jgi:hypothetical protein